MKNNMKIYRLYSKTDGYRSIAYRKTPLMNIIGEKNRVDNIEIENFPYEWDEENEYRRVSDSPFLIGAIPIFSQRTMNKIKDFLTEDMVELIPISIEKKKFEVVRAKIRMANLLDEKRSKITRFSDGRIMSVEKYVFKNNGNLPLLFQLQQYPLFTFATGILADKLFELCPSGLCLEECKIHESFFAVCRVKDFFSK